MLSNYGSKPSSGIKKQRFFGVSYALNLDQTHLKFMNKLIDLKNGCVVGCVELKMSRKFTTVSLKIEFQFSRRFEWSENEYDNDGQNWRSNT